MFLRKVLSYGDMAILVMNRVRLLFKSAVPFDFRYGINRLV